LKLFEIFESSADNIVTGKRFMFLAMWPCNRSILFLLRIADICVIHFEICIFLENT